MFNKNYIANHMDHSQFHRPMAHKFLNGSKRLYYHWGIKN